MESLLKVGVYVDVENIRRNGGFRMKYGTLRKFAARGNAEVIRLNAYAGYDRKRAEVDDYYRENISRFFSAIRDFGYKVIEKKVKWFTDEDGRTYAKANADLDMAVDAILQSENLDRVVLATGDGDFIQVVRALQNKGCRVEVIAFKNISKQLVREADLFISGYSIPNLLPSPKDRGAQWGEIGSRVRGTCYFYKPVEGYGFLRFMNELGPIWITDPREKGSPFESAFFHATSLPNNFDPGLLPSREYIFEFTLAESSQEGQKFVARDLILQE